MDKPVEDMIHIRSGALDDPERWAHGLRRQIVPIAKIAVELIERNAAVALGHIVEGFLNRRDVLLKCLCPRMQPSPFIENFFRGQLDTVRTELVAEKAVKIAKLFSSFGRHDVLRCEALILPERNGASQARRKSP